MRYKIDHDLHIHSKLSSCSRDPGQTTEAILRYAEENGLKKICITDHYWDEKVPGASSWYAPQNTTHIRESLPLPKSDKVEFLFACEIRERELQSFVKSRFDRFPGNMQAMVGDADVADLALCLGFQHGFVKAGAVSGLGAEGGVVELVDVDVVGLQPLQTGAQMLPEDLRRGGRSLGGEDDVLAHMVQGAAQLSLSLPEARFVFILPPSLEELERRLRGRGTDSEEAIRLRLANARSEIMSSHWFDAIIINDDLDTAYDQLRSFYLASTLQPSLQPQLARAICGK